MKKTHLRNSQISEWKTNFFPRQAMPKILFVLQSSYPWNTWYRVWLDLDKSSTRWKRPIFKYIYLKIFGNNSKFPYEILTFFLGKLYKKTFLLYNLVTHGILDAEFGSVWTTPWPDQNYYISKLNIWNNSKFPYEKLTFFLGKLYQNFFLHYNLHTTGSLGYQFGSLWTTPWPDEKDLFLKFVICEIRKFSYEKLTFFLGKLYQKFFLHYNLHTTGSLGYHFGSFWTTPGPDKKDPFLKFVICEIRKFPNENITFFLGKLCQKTFCFTI